MLILFGNAINISSARILTPTVELLGTPNTINYNFKLGKAYPYRSGFGFFQCTYLLIHSSEMLVSILIIMSQSKSKMPTAKRNFLLGSIVHLLRAGPFCAFTVITCGRRLAAFLVLSVGAALRSLIISLYAMFARSRFRTTWSSILFCPLLNVVVT